MKCLFCELNTRSLCQQCFPQQQNLYATTTITTNNNNNSNNNTAAGATATAALTTTTKLNSVALVRERTIPTERPPPVDEVSANFRG